MHFLLGLIVGTLMGMVIIALCRCVAVSACQMECRESLGGENARINKNRADIVSPFH